MGPISIKKIIQSNGFEIAGVVLRYDNQDSVLREIAKSNNIPVYLFEKVNGQDVIDLIKGLDIELGVSMSYNQIIKSELRSSTKLGFINCHAGKLPFYRGRNILNWAMINDEKEIGVTVHFIDDGIDTGDIICQQMLTIEEHDDYSSILKKAIHKCPDILLEGLEKIKNNQYVVTQQRNLPGTYFSYRRDGDEYIDWNWSSRRIFNLVRAITKPGPGAYTYLGDKKVYIWKTKMTGIPEYLSTPGEVIAIIPGKGNIIKTGDTAVLVELISMENSQDLVNSNFKVGTRLGFSVPIKLKQLEDRITKLENQLTNGSSLGQKSAVENNG